MDFDSAWDMMVNENVGELPQNNKDIVIRCKTGWASMQFLKFTGDEADKETFRKAIKYSKELAGGVVSIKLTDKKEPGSRHNVKKSA